MIAEALMFGPVVGIAATLTMDLLAKVSRRAGLTAGVDASWMGRWFHGVSRGRIAHADIRVAPERAGERRLAKIVHYAIGIVLATTYLVGSTWLGIRSRDFLPAMAFGLATCVFPWFLMFPGMGFGVFGWRGPREARLVRSSLVNHLFFGLGIWWVAQLLPLG